MGNENPKNYQFRGFQSPNYTPVPDEFFDSLMDLLQPAEIKVLLYIIRRTFGFKKRTDRISKSQLENGIKRRDGTILDRGVGLSRRAIRLAIDGLVKKKIILKKNIFSQEKGNETTEYALNITAHDPWVLSTQGGGTEVPKPVGTVVPTQETVLQKNNVNVGFVRNGGKKPANDYDDKTDSEAYLLSEIVRHTGDTNPKSLSSFRRVIRKLGSGVSERILVITKEAYQEGRVPAPKRAAYFINTAKNMAKERGIDLEFRNGSGQVQTLVANLSKQIGNRGIVRNMKSDHDEAE